MNANRYHVSKNLFDAATAYGSMYNNGVVSGTTFDINSIRNSFNESQIGKQITLSIRADKVTATRIFIIANVSGTSYNSNSIYEGNMGVMQITVVPQNTSDYWLISYGSNANNECIISNIMLNTGSTALPYEPYSSEVWHDIPHYIMGTSTDTITTLPAVVYANDTTATIGLKGNMEQSGTPTPDNPIQPSECGDRTANLFDYQTMAVSATGYYLDATGQELSGNGWKISDYIPCNGNEFTINKIGGIAPAICLYDANKQFLTGKSYQTGDSGIKIPVTINSTTNAKYIRFSYVTINPSDNLSEIIITEGATAPSEYIPYGYKIPILNGSQTTNVYLGQVQSTRRIVKVEFSGNEDWQLVESSPTNRFFNISLSQNNFPISMTSSPSVSVQFNLIIFVSNGAIIRIYDNTGFFTTETDFKAYLAAQYAAGTPVTVWYVLATPETAVVNEPIRKIGDYADTLSNTSIPTIAGANTISVGTTLQPSEVTVNYKGWHPVVNGHESESGQWD